VKTTRSVAFGAVLALMLFPVASATAPAIAQTEIAYLLGFIERSECRFYRNGSWYDSKKAREHLHDKYNLLAQGNQIDTAEDFIEKAASRSSLTGEPYRTRCSDGIDVPTNQWLQNELIRYRRHTARLTCG
jgi:hypothetical protein